jgi:hypothetical protein
MLCGVTSCGPVRGLPPEQAELVAWYIEDVIHGAHRQPTELILPNPAPGMERVASWLAGGHIKGTLVHPRQIDERIRRWSALRSLFLQRQVVVLNDGLVAPAPALTREDLTYVLPVVDAENQDRRSIDALIISLSNADHAAAKSWVAWSASARLALDKQAGATHWQLPAVTNRDPRIRLE